ncbi:Biopolymer transport protein ExbD/TolR [Rubripirellula amarantea]|uniref:Biopolymer transport protein ExbD/TolR n=1 Tax=Rubripirellula amarantea TaxID=2527999 RepID=A0A5C5WTG8_9BACT|nr:biopolymer transporter ExbD [Rubripirellula amarantea]TWT53445.1 Biopolymer transport protein ExbD/TolR [Rubripirellula amarantea]
MKIPNTHNNDSMELKMTPMIDVVFLLLVFFVWTSSFELPEFDLPSSIATPPGGTLQNNSTSPPEAFDEIVIRLFARGASLGIELNGNEIQDTDQLSQHLAEIIAMGVQPPVIVDPDDDVTMDYAVAVYDAARSAGVDRVLFAASE